MFVRGCVISLAGCLVCPILSIRLQFSLFFFALSLSLTLVSYNWTFRQKKNGSINLNQWQIINHSFHLWLWVHHSRQLSLPNVCVSSFFLSCFYFLPNTRCSWEKQVLEAVCRIVFDCLGISMVFHIRRNEMLLNDEAADAAFYFIMNDELHLYYNSKGQSVEKRRKRKLTSVAVVGVKEMIISNEYFISMVLTFTHFCMATNTSECLK